MDQAQLIIISPITYCRQEIIRHPLRSLIPSSAKRLKFTVREYQQRLFFLTNFDDVSYVKPRLYDNTSTTKPSHLAIHASRHGRCHSHFVAIMMTTSMAKMASWTANIWLMSC